MTSPQRNNDEVIEQALVWILGEQRTVEPNKGTWSNETDIAELFLTTNHVLYALLKLGYPPNSEPIKYGISWIASQLSNTKLHMEDRANALSTLLLSGESGAAAAEELLGHLERYASQAASFQKPLFPVFVLDCVQEFKLQIAPSTVSGLWTFVQNRLDSDGTLDRKIPLSAYLARVMHRSSSVPANISGKKSAILTWLQQNWRDINGQGWDLAICVNSFVLIDAVEMGLGLDPAWKKRIGEVTGWLRDCFSSSGHWGPDDSAAKRIKNAHYTTAVALRAFSYGVQSADALSRECSLHLLDSAYTREHSLRQRLSRVLKLRRTVPAGVGLGLGILLGSFVERLLTEHPGPVEDIFHIGMLIVSLGVILYFELAPKLKKEP